MAIKGLSFAETAERAGIALTTLSALVHDDCRASAKTTLKLADGLNCSQETLFPELSFWTLKDETVSA